MQYKKHGLITGRAPRGSALAVTLVMIALLSMGLLWMAQTVLAHQGMNKRKHELSRAFYAAEAGVAQVQHWGNFPADYTPNPSLFERVDPETLMGGGEEEGEETIVDLSANPELLFPSLAAEVDSGSFLLDQATLDNLDVGRFTSDYQYDVAHIKEIELLSSSAGDPINCFFKIRSLGESPDGIERTVLTYMDVSPVVIIRIPAPLISHNVAAVVGNARIHWGEAWAKNDFNMLNKSQLDYLDPSDSNYDPRAKYRSEGQINFPANWQWGENKDLFDPTRSQPGEAPASGDYVDAFYQHLPEGTLEWPDFDYQTFKDLAMSHGRYYSTDAAGNIYRDGIEDAAHQVDFLTEFGVANRDAAPYDFVFIDTINGQPPAADGSNLATISASGNSLGLKGVFWIGANFDAAGVGSPPSLTAEDPDGNSFALSQIFLDGVIYAAGTTEMSGNAGVYGSVITQRGFSGGGTPDVYYNARLADGLLLDNGNIGSVFKVALHTNY